MNRTAAKFYLFMINDDDDKSMDKITATYMYVCMLCKNK